MTCALKRTDDDDDQAGASGKMTGAEAAWGDGGAEGTRAEMTCAAAGGLVGAATFGDSEGALQRPSGMAQA